MVARILQACINGSMKRPFHVGDVIERTRKERRWNQVRLGAEAANFKLSPKDGPIDKSTVSKVENDPFSSELGTVWRLLAALDLTFADVEAQTSSPFVHGNAPPIREQQTAKPRAGKSASA